MRRLISDRMSYRNHHMCSGNAISTHPCIVLNVAVKISNAFTSHACKLLSSSVLDIICRFKTACRDLNEYFTFNGFVSS